MSILSRPLFQTESSLPDEKSLERKLLQSKLETLNNTLKSLIQKKIRIDLEIKRTKKKLSKLKNSSEITLKTRVELEGFSYESLTPETVELFKKQVSEREYKEIFELDREIFFAEQLIQEAEQLPLFEE